MGPCLGAGRLLGGKRDRRKGEEERTLEGIPLLWSISIFSKFLTFGLSHSHPPDLETVPLHLCCIKRPMFLCSGWVTSSRDEVVKYLLSLVGRGGLS